MDYKELNLKRGDLLTAEHMAHIEQGIDFVTAEASKLKEQVLPEPIAPFMHLVTNEENKWVQEERTHYAYTSIQEIIPTTDLIFEEQTEGLEKIFLFPTPLLNSTPVVGEICDFQYNGTTYHLTTKMITDTTEDEFGNISLISLYCWGDTTIFNEDETDSDVHFLFIHDHSNQLESWAGLSCMFIDEIGNMDYCTIAINGKAETLKTIDKKFLSNLRGQKTITLTENSSNSYTSSVPFNEAWTMTATELQNAIEIKNNELKFGSGNSVFAVDKIEYGQSKAIQFCLIGFNDYKQYGISILQWYDVHPNTVFIEGYYSLSPHNSNSEKAITVVDAGSSRLSCAPVSVIKEMLGIQEPFLINVTLGDEEALTTDHYSEDIYNAFKAGREIYIIENSGGRIPLNIGNISQHSCSFNYFTWDEYDKLLFYFELTITENSVKVAHKYFSPTN